MSKRLVVFNQSAGYLMVDILNAHCNSYEQVILVTGKLNPRQTQLNGKVQVIKIITYDRSSTFKRLYTWVIGFIQMSWIALRLRKNSHFLLVSNPPLCFFIPAAGADSYSLLVYDIYPNALIDYKYLKKDSLLVKIWKRANKNIYQRAKNVFTLSDGMKEVLKEYVTDDKIKVIPVWTDSEFLKPIPKSENTFLSQNNFQNKFIVQYSGNIGKTHSVEILLQLAQKMKEFDDIHFVIIGEGTQKGDLLKDAHNRKLINISFLPWQPTAVLPYSLAAADIGVVTLGTDASNLSVPSKTFNLMSVGVPLLCVASSSSELARLTNHYQLGKCFEANHEQQMIEFVLELYKDRSKRNLYSLNALKAAEDFTPSNALLIQ